jgi:ribosomal protein S18 acetylase RimI-like enzyme
VTSRDRTGPWWAGGADVLVYSGDTGCSFDSAFVARFEKTCRTTADLGDGILQDQRLPHACTHEYLCRMRDINLTPLAFSDMEIAQVVELYASNPEYGHIAGEYDPADVKAAQVESDLRGDVRDGFEVLLATDDHDRVVGMVGLLSRHPVDGFPWVGLLMVHGSLQRSGIGRALAAAVERLLVDRGERAVRLAVLEKNSSAEAFWRSLGWVEIDRRPDSAYGRPCIVMHKALQASPDARRMDGPDVKQAPFKQ